MNILFLTSTYLPDIGGIESVLHHLNEQFKGHNNHVVVVSDNKRKYKFHEILDSTNVYRIPLFVFGYSLKGSIVFFLFLPFILLSLLYVVTKHKIEIIHVHAIDRNAFYARVISVICRVPLVTTVHGVDVSGLFVSGKDVKSLAWQRNNILRTVKKSVYVTAPSEHMRQYLLSLVDEESKEKIFVIPNAIDFEEFEKYPVSQEPYLDDNLVFIGRLEHRKGADIAIKAFAQLLQDNPEFGHIKLIIVGGGSQEKTLRELVNQLGIQSKVNFLGALTDRKAIISLLRGATCCLVSSRQEAFGIVCLEVLAAGRPLVATRVGGIPEVIVDEVDALLVPSEDIESFAFAIKRILTGQHHLSTAQQLIDKASSYSWYSISQKYLNLYRRVLGKSYE
jgi:glycosyltransferase involved in cell wall biosynthesis